MRLFKFTTLTLFTCIVSNRSIFSNAQQLSINDLSYVNITYETKGGGGITEGPTRPSSRRYATEQTRHERVKWVWQPYYDDILTEYFKARVKIKFHIPKPSMGVTLEIVTIIVTIATYSKILELDPMVISVLPHRIVVLSSTIMLSVLLLMSLPPASEWLAILILGAAVTTAITTKSEYLFIPSLITIASISALLTALIILTTIDKVQFMNASRQLVLHLIEQALLEVVPVLGAVITSAILVAFLLTIAVKKVIDKLLDPNEIIKNGRMEGLSVAFGLTDSDKLMVLLKDKANKITSETLNKIIADGMYAGESLVIRLIDDRVGREILAANDYKLTKLISNATMFATVLNPSSRFYQHSPLSMASSNPEAHQIFGIHNELRIEKAILHLYCSNLLALNKNVYTKKMPKELSNSVVEMLSGRNRPPMIN